MLKKIFRYRYLLVFVSILLFATVTRLYRLAEPREYIFDEVYHALTAKLIRRNDPRAFEWWNPPVEPQTAVDWLHPPFAKYTQAFGMDVFGENTFGWRISAAVFGILVILATAQLADEIFHSRKIALCAAAFASLDGLLLVQSRIAMNDIHVTFFILLTLICYLRYRQRRPARTRWRWLFLTGLSAGLAIASKWSGMFVLGAVCTSEVSCWVYFHLFKKRKKSAVFVSASKLAFGILSLLILPVAIYLLSYWQMFWEGKTLFCEGNQVEQGKCYCHQDSSWWVTTFKQYGPQSTWLWETSAKAPFIWQHLPNHPTLINPTSYMPNFWENLEARGGCKRLISHFWELHHQIWYYQTHLTATHPFQSRPLEWFLDLRPVWFYTHNNLTTAVNIYAFGNPLLFWLGNIAVLITLDYVLARFILRLLDRKKHVSTVDFRLLFVLLCYGIVWLPWEFSPRIMFFYHYTPAVPLLCILLSYWLIRLEKMNLKFLTYLVLAAIFLCFMVWYPDWTALPVPSSFANHVYFFLPSWK